MTTALLILGLFLVAFVVLLMFAKFVKFALSVLLCIVLFLAVLIFVVIADVHTLSKPHDKPTLFLLVSEDKAINAHVAGESTQLDGTTWKTIRDDYPNNLNSLKRSYFKIVSIDTSVLSRLNNSDIALDIKKIPYDVALGIMRAEDPLPLLVAYELLLPDSFAPPSNMSRDEQALIYQQEIFSIILRDRLFSSPATYFDSFREGTITIIPRTAWFIFLKYTPKSLLSKGLRVVPHV